MHEHTGTGRHTDDTRGTGGFTRGGGICSTRVGGGRDDSWGSGGIDILFHRGG